MKKQKGLYLVPTKKQRFGLLFCDGENFKKLYSNSYAKELISIISTDSDAIIMLNQGVNKRGFTICCDCGAAMPGDKPEVLDGVMRPYRKPFPDDRKGYEKAIGLQRKIYCDFGVAFQNAKVLTSIYAELPCPLEEKPKLILEIDEHLLDHSYSETFFISKEKQTEDNFGLTKCYVFDSAENYLNYLLLNLIQLNPNICLCQNCGELFVAKTKKKTLYCDRIQPDGNKKCSEIGPKNRAELQSTLFGFEDYGKAVERNYQRAKRTEEYYVKDKEHSEQGSNG